VPRHRKIIWKIPLQDGWKRVELKDMPTYYLICLMQKFAKKGYTKMRGLVNNEDEWMLRYVTQLETEFDKRTDVDEYL
jgi:hypothetical protein